MLEGYDRAIFEEQVHLKQKSHNKYKNRFLQYGFPANDFKFPASA